MAEPSSAVAAAPAPPLHLQLLGAFRVGPGMPPAPRAAPLSARAQALLAYLALHAGEPQPRASLAARFWPDSSDEQARTNLRKAVHELRRALPDADRCLAAAGQALAWRADAPARVDVAAFQLAAGRADTAAAIAAAVALYRGDLLPGWYDDWVAPERERLRGVLAALLERGLAQAEAAGEYAAALGYARRWRDHDPLDEAAYRHLMRLAARRGDRVAALRAYRACAETLARELGVEPSPETRDLHEQLLAHRPLAAPAPAAPGGPAPKLAP